MVNEDQRWLHLPNAERERRIRYVKAFILGQMRKRNMKAAEFARFSGVRKDTISTYLTEKSAPHDFTLRQIAKACGVRIDEIMPDPNPVVANEPTATAEFGITAVDGSDRVVLHINKVVSLKVALEIGRLINDANAVDRD